MRRSQHLVQLFGQAVHRSGIDRNGARDGCADRLAVAQENHKLRREGRPPFSEREPVDLPPTKADGSPPESPHLDALLVRHESGSSESVHQIHERPHGHFSLPRDQECAWRPVHQDEDCDDRRDRPEERGPEPHRDQEADVVAGIPERPVRPAERQPLGNRHGGATIVHPVSPCAAGLLTFSGASRRLGRLLMSRAGRTMPPWKTWTLVTFGRLTASTSPIRWSEKARETSPASSNTATSNWPGITRTRMDSWAS